MALAMKEFTLSFYFDKVSDNAKTTLNSCILNEQLPVTILYLSRLDDYND